MSATYHGAVITKNDALHLIHACERGDLKYATHPETTTEEAPMEVKDGDVLVWKQKQQDTKWYDGRNWSVGHRIGLFLQFIELDETNEKVKIGGLFKRTLLKYGTSRETQIRVASYYTKEEIDTLARPSKDPKLTKHPLPGNDGVGRLYQSPWPRENDIPDTIIFHPLHLKCLQLQIDLIQAPKPDSEPEPKRKLKLESGPEEPESESEYRKKEAAEITKLLKEADQRRQHLARRRRVKPLNLSYPLEPLEQYPETEEATPVVMSLAPAVYQSPRDFMQPPVRNTGEVSQERFTLYEQRFSPPPGEENEDPRSQNSSPSVEDTSANTASTTPLNSFEMTTLAEILRNSDKAKKQ